MGPEVPEGRTAGFSAKESTRKKVLKPADKRNTVKYLVSELKFSVRQAEQLVDLSPGVYVYQPRKKKEDLISKQLLRIAGLHPEFGFEQMRKILINEGFVTSQKQIYRVYKMLDLKTRRQDFLLQQRLAANPRWKPRRRGLSWVIQDAVAFPKENKGIRIPVLLIYRGAGGEKLAEIPKTRSAETLIQSLESLFGDNGKPYRIRVWWEPSRIVFLALEAWCRANDIKFSFRKEDFVW